MRWARAKWRSGAGWAELWFRDGLGRPAVPAQASTIRERVTPSSLHYLTGHSILTCWSAKRLKYPHHARQAGGRSITALGGQVTGLTQNIGSSTKPRLLGLDLPGGQVHLERPTIPICLSLWGSQAARNMWLTPCKTHLLGAVSLTPVVTDRGQFFD